MKRILAFGLILGSSWLVVQSLALFATADANTMSPLIMAAAGDSDFLVPLLGAALGLVGGVTILLGGTGGAAIALTGGVILAAYSFATAQSFAVSGLSFWENEAVLGLALLLTAATALVAPPVEA